MEIYDPEKLKNSFLVKYMYVLFDFFIFISLLYALVCSVHLTFLFQGVKILIKIISNLTIFDFGFFMNLMDEIERFCFLMERT